MSKYHEGPHKYQKKKIGNKVKPYTIWKCMLPGCPHHIKYELGENRHTVCWRCGDTTILTKLVMDLTRPHCAKCTRGRKEDELVNDGIRLLTALFGKEEVS